MVPNSFVKIMMDTKTTQLSLVYIESFENFRTLSIRGT